LSRTGELPREGDADVAWLTDRNPAVEQQAIDRIHRLGQKRPVRAVRLFIRDSVEEKLDKIQKRKANLADVGLKPMSRAELLAKRVSADSVVPVQAEMKASGSVLMSRRKSSPSCSSRRWQGRSAVPRSQWAAGRGM
jgi:hypothetical protein